MERHTKCTRIELSGSPSSGKNSIIRELHHTNIFDHCEVIEATSYKQPHLRGSENFEVKVLWSIFETCNVVKNNLEAETISSADLILFNRGIFDRLAWARLLQIENRNYRTIVNDIESWIIRQDVLRELNMIVLLLTPYEKLITRRKNKSISRVINPMTIDRLNRIYLDLYDEMKNDVPIVLLSELENALSLSQKVQAIKTRLNRILLPQFDSI